MKRILITLLLFLPVTAFAQLWAPGNDYKFSVVGSLVTGQTDTVYVFYDDNVITLTARQASGNNSEFTWYKLNTSSATFTLDQVFQQTSVTTSTFADIEEGGYQVIVQDLVNLLAIDTFTTWVFRDTFRIDSIRYSIDCNVLQLNMFTTPYIFENYTIYNFKQALQNPGTGATIFNQVQNILWTPSVDIFPGISGADQSWRTRRSWLTYVDSPPPLRSASYTLEVTDVFGKVATYTTPYTINAIAAYAQPTVEEMERNGNWRPAGDQPEGEALYIVRFSHNQSVNAHNFKWKGFADRTDRTLVWTDSTTNIYTYINPRMPYRGQIFDGYTPGTYQVRLIVNNNVCTDSSSIFIVVEPSRFSADAVPNAFTPNGDGINDIFTFVRGSEPVSMEFIRVFIYSRGGGLVYRYEGRADLWEGWDGRMMGSGSDVSEGVYYYVISGRGWDDVNYDSREFSGYLHLFR